MRNKLIYCIPLALSITCLIGCAAKAAQMPTEPEPVALLPEQKQSSIVTNDAKNETIPTPQQSEHEENPVRIVESSTADILHKFRAVVAVRALPEDVEIRQEQAAQIIGKLLPPRPHGLQRRLQRRVPLLGDLHRKDDGGGVGEAAKRPRVGGFDDEAAPKGVIRVPAPEGIHPRQILGQAEGGVVVLRAGDPLQNTGQHRTRLCDDDKNLLVRSVHKAPSHAGRPVRRRDVWVIRGSFRRLSRQKGVSILSITAMDVKAVLCQGHLEKCRHSDFVTVL